MIHTRPGRSSLILFILILAGMVFLPSWALADGPTPYPNPKDAAAWPGKGPIRCFGWMVDNRKAFWAHREKDQGKIVLAGDSLTGGWNAKVLAGYVKWAKLLKGAFEALGVKPDAK